MEPSQLIDIPSRFYPETKEKANNIKGYVAFYKARRQPTSTPASIRTDSYDRQNKVTIE